MTLLPDVTLVKAGVDDVPTGSSSSPSSSLPSPLLTCLYTFLSPPHHASPLSAFTYNTQLRRHCTHTPHCSRTTPVYCGTSLPRDVYAHACIIPPHYTVRRLRVSIVNLKMAIVMGLGGGTAPLPVWFTPSGLYWAPVIVDHWAKLSCYPFLSPLNIFAAYFFAVVHTCSTFPRTPGSRMVLLRRIPLQTSARNSANMHLRKDIPTPLRG